MIGKIVNYDGETLTIQAEYYDSILLEDRNVTEVEIRLKDGREISREQQKKVYALLRDIGDYTGYVGEDIKDIMKYDFIAKTGCDEFSLSDVDMTTARNFIEHLIEFCLINDIPCRDSLLSYTSDIGKYVYLCLLHKKCCISGKRAELHHTDAVGMGRNRNEITHIGMRAMPLSRKYHNEVHTIGQAKFNEKYHIYGVKIDKVIASKYRQIRG